MALQIRLRQRIANPKDAFKALARRSRVGLLVCTYGVLIGVSVLATSFAIVMVFVVVNTFIETGIIGYLVATIVGFGFVAASPIIAWRLFAKGVNALEMQTTIRLPSAHMGSKPGAGPEASEESISKAD